MSNVLIVEDEAEIRRFVRHALTAEDVQVFEAATLQRGIIEAGMRKPDLVIVDLGLPDGDGTDLVRELRTWSQVPVLVLSARGDEPQKIAALDAGADDYLTKPFGVGEMLARVRALLRRSLRGPAQSAPLLALGNVEVDLAARMVRKNGAPVHLTPIEFRLLACLVVNAGRVMTYRQLVSEVWGPTYGEQTHYARVAMQRLRQKLEDDAAQPKFLLTEIGVGYRLVLP
ncbi:MAG: two-component system response regulator KdpE [Betaproteobacteria bacterium]